MAPKEEMIINILIGLLGLIIIFLIVQAFSAKDTALFAPLMIIIVLLVLIAAALFYHSRLIRSLAQRKMKRLSSARRFRGSRKEEADVIAELEAKLFGDITETMSKLEKK